MCFLTAFPLIKTKLKFQCDQKEQDTRKVTQKCFYCSHQNVVLQKLQTFMFSSRFLPLDKKTRFVQLGIVLFLVVILQDMNIDVTGKVTLFHTFLWFPFSSLMFTSYENTSTDIILRLNATWFTSHANYSGIVRTKPVYTSWGIWLFSSSSSPLPPPSRFLAWVKALNEN